MKHLFKIILACFLPFLLISCGLINSEEEIDYDWYGEWKRTDTDTISYLVLTADHMYTLTGTLTPEEWNHCGDYFSEYSMIRKSEEAFTFSWNGDPLYVGIEQFSEDLNSLTLRFEGESETESYTRTELPDNCTFPVSDSQ